MRRAPNPSGQPWVQVGAGRGTVGSPGAVGVGSIDDRVLECVNTAVNDAGEGGA